MISKDYRAPVLFLVFNRPDTTEKVFAEIRKAKPKKLYVAADGPRKNRVGEKELCEKVRKIATCVDWDCKVKTLFRKNNLGCGKAVSSAISWFFKNEEMGIILEDDCLPDQSFFPFCENLLIKYKNNPKIMHISGNNFLYYRNDLAGSSSYYFSIYPHIWGWATWRRAWGKYNFNLNNVDSNTMVNKIKSLFSSSSVAKRWEKIYFAVQTEKIDTWDYQWGFSLWLNNALSIIPRGNLVSNIGISFGSTHKNSNFMSSNKTISVKTIVHPKVISRNIPADNFVSNILFNDNKFDLNKILIRVINFTWSFLW